MTETDTIITRTVANVDAEFRAMAVASGRIGQFGLLAALEARVIEHRRRLRAERQAAESVAYTTSTPTTATYPTTEG